MSKSEPVLKHNVLQDFFKEPYENSKAMMIKNFFF